MDFYHSLAKEIYVAKRSARANRLGALVLSIGLITGLGACSPVHTLDIFDPSDGVRAVLDGEVKATNHLILAEAQDGPGTLVGSLTNTAGTDLEVAVTVGEEEPILVDLDAGHTAYLTPDVLNFDGNSLSVDAQISSVGAAPGGSINVSVATASGGSTNVEVPVLDGTLEPYDQYLP